MIWVSSTEIFYLIYTNLFICEKSPLWKVFPSPIPVHYGTIIKFQGETTTHSLQNVGSPPQPSTELAPMGWAQSSITSTFWASVVQGSGVGKSEYNDCLRV